MSRIVEFMNNDTPENEERVPGNYGCSSCEEDMEFANFNEAKGLLYWVCSKGHRTEMQFG